MKTVEYAEKQLGIKLLPWQKEFLEALARGERTYLPGGQRAGRTVLKKAWKEMNPESESDD